MRKLAAAMRDKAAQTWKTRKLYYKVGSCFKGCHNCGEVRFEDRSGKKSVEDYYADYDYEDEFALDAVENEGGKQVKRYITGHNVFRAFDPKAMGFTYWCYDCGAKDEACWENANDIGEQKSFKPSGKRRSSATVSQGTIKPPVKVTKTVIQVQHKQVTDQLDALAAKLAALQNVLKSL